MKLHFTKMHGAGNDFVVLDATREPLTLDAAAYRRLADRRFGVGADQILIVGPPDGDDVDFTYRIINADGGEVEQCGNGSRCFVRFVRNKGLTTRRTVRVRTLGGVIELQEAEDGRVRVDMGVPRLDPADLPFDATGLDSRAVQQLTQWPLSIDGQPLWLGLVSMGNPHAVLRVESVDSAPVADWGPRLETHPRFPRRVNVGFLQVLAPDRVRLRVHERGVGETLACGTGACAAAVVGRLAGWLAARVQVQARGGELQIDWAGPGEPVFMTGPAETVFEGELEL